MPVFSFQMPLGVLLPYTSGTAPDGWLLCDGDTIGDASSGADNESPDYEALFKHLWDNSTDSELAVSSGRGASAQADWDAGKTIENYDMRGRVPVGKDNLGGSSANVVTDAEADVLAGQEGDENSEQHSHDLKVETTNGTESASAGNLLSDSQEGDTQYSATTTPNNSLHSNSIANTGTGSSGNKQPYTTVAYIIHYLGS